MNFMESELVMGYISVICAFRSLKKIVIFINAHVPVGYVVM